VDDLLKVRERFQDFSDGDRESVKGLIANYLQTTGAHFDELRTAVSLKDPKAIARAAHQAIGASDMFGVSTLADLLRRVEDAAGRRDLSEADLLAAQARREYERVRAGLSCTRPPDCWPSMS
jgi:HPt (histidine-containing phosphotransfer) domain-containing protein